MSHIVMLYVGSRVLAFLVATFASSSAISFSLIPLWNNVGGLTGGS